MHGKSARRLRIGTAGAALAAALVGTYAGPGQAQDSGESLDEQRRCLALAMYWEARSEGPEGMRAVGSVVLNRVGSEDFPGTPCEVVYEGGEEPPCQFSWWCDGRSDRPRDLEQWQAAIDVAAELLMDRGDDPTQGALFFHSAKIEVPWRVERVRTVQILDHVYYR